MSVERKKFKGWNVREAASRCVDTTLRERRDQAREIWKNAGYRTRKPAGYSFWDRDDERDHREREGWKAYLDLEAATKDETKYFRKLLLDGKLIAWGRVAQPTAELRPIPASAWSNLKFRKNPSVVSQPDGSKIYDVSIFPRVHDQSAPTALSRLSLREAFFEFVLGDPEVSKLGADVVRSVGHRDVFENGRAPGPTICYDWRLSAKTEEIAHEFVRCGVVIIGSPPPSIPPELELVSAALHDRIEALQSILRSGDVVAKGTFVQTGAEQNISQAQWSRDAIYIDVKNSDVKEGIDGKIVTVWSGIGLLRRDLASQAPIESSETPSVTHVKSSNKSKVDCTRWLIEEMRKSPDSKPKPKADYWRDAQARFGPSLSYGAFKIAWADAVAEAQAFAWSASGAPRKSA